VLYQNLALLLSVTYSGNAPDCEPYLYSKGVSNHQEHNGSTLIWFQCDQEKTKMPSLMGRWLSNLHISLFNFAKKFIVGVLGNSNCEFNNYCRKKLPNFRFKNSQNFVKKFQIFVHGLNFK